MTTRLFEIHEEVSIFITIKNLKEIQNIHFCNQIAKYRLSLNCPLGKELPFQIILI